MKGIYKYRCRRDPGKILDYVVGCKYKATSWNLKKKLPSVPKGSYLVRLSAYYMNFMPNR